MTQSEIRNIAQEIHEITCSSIDDHLVCAPNARGHEPVENAIAGWHLEKVSQLQSRNAELEKQYQEFQGLTSRMIMDKNARNAELEARVKELELQLTPQINKYEIGQLSGGPGPGPLWSTQEIAKQVENEIQEG